LSASTIPPKTVPRDRFGRPIGGAPNVPHVPVVAEVTRSGIVESRHHGHVVGLDTSGAVVLAVGDITTPVFGRSSNKPLQAVAMLRLGLDVDDEQLALVTASHSGEPRHLAIVRRLLDERGLRVDDLANTPAWPLDDRSARDIVRTGGTATSLTQNCSGKHAGMLATCVANGWPIDSYLEADHPLQRGITAVFAELAGEPVAHIGIDGCGAPVHAISLTGLARAFRTLVTAPIGTPERRAADVMRTHPELVGGDKRDVTLLMQNWPGLLAKDGAEGVYVAATAGGAAVALKIDDGAGRARSAVLLAAFEAIGADVAVELRDRLRVPVLGHGRAVGEVRAVGLR
jgi:L-asparaginase II